MSACTDKNFRMPILASPSCGSRKRGARRIEGPSRRNGAVHNGEGQPEDFLGFSSSSRFRSFHISRKPQKKRLRMQKERGLLGGKIVKEDRAAYAVNTPAAVTFLEDLLCVSQVLARRPGANGWMDKPISALKKLDS